MPTAIVIALSLSAAALDDAPLSSKVDCQFIIPADDAAFAGAVIEAQLWEFDLRIADKAADRFDRLLVENVAHTRGEQTVIKFTLGRDDKAPNPDRRYYITARAFRAGKIDNAHDFYHGQPTHNDIGKVLTEGHPTDITFHAKRLK